jgi:hypothetical protein
MSSWAPILVGHLDHPIPGVEPNDGIHWVLTTTLLNLSVTGERDLLPCILRLASFTIGELILLKG